MCYLCLKDNPFAIEDMKRASSYKKKARALQIKQMLRAVEDNDVCDDGKLEVDKLKEEQYRLSREF